MSAEEEKQKCRFKSQICTKCIKNDFKRGEKRKCLLLKVMFTINRKEESNGYFNAK